MSLDKFYFTLINITLHIIAPPFSRGKSSALVPFWIHFVNNQMLEYIGSPEILHSLVNIPFVMKTLVSH